MARDPINTGTVPGDGTGDKLYEAFGKVNANETELYTNVATAQATADGAQSDATQALSDASDAQATADSAQSTADSAIPSTDKSDNIDDANQTKVAQVSVVKENATYTEAVVLNSTLSNSYIASGATSIETSPDFTTRLYRVEDVEQLKIEGDLRGGSGAQLYAFYESETIDASNLISERLGTDGTESVDIYVNVPSNAVIFTITKNPLVDEIIPLSVKAVNVIVKEDLAGNITYGSDIPVNSVLNNQYISNGATSIVTNSGFLTKLYDVTVISKIIINGDLRGGDTLQLYGFYETSTIDASNLISERIGNGGTESFDTILDVPDGATIFTITKNPLTNEVVPLASVSVKENINNIYAELEQLNPTVTTINYTTDTFTGEVNKAFSDAQTKWPSAKILVCTSLKNGGYPSEDNLDGVNMTYLTKNRIDKFQKDYNSRIIDCAKLHSLPVLDLYTLAGYDPLNSAQSAIYTHDTSDKLHPIQAGHIRIADLMEQAINRLFPQGTTGLKAIFIGDSITSNEAAHTPKVYYKYLAERLLLQDDGISDGGWSTRNTIDYPKNAGISGSGYSSFCPVDDPINERLSGYNSDYELVVIFAGVNDFYSNTSGVFGNIYN